MSSHFTSVDVAKLAGVSQSTVSRTFKNDSSVSPETRKRVLAAAQKLNYVRNSFARGLSTQKSNIIAIVIGDLKNPFYSESLFAFGRELKKHGKYPLLFNVGGGNQVDDVIHDVLGYQVDGIIITAANTTMKTAQICLNRGIPVVAFNRYIPGIQVNSVCCDNVKASQRLGELLLQAGARNFGVIYGDREASNNHDRLTGFYTALATAGVNKRHAKQYLGSYTYEGGYEAALKAFSSTPKPDALFCLNDVMALGAIDAVKYKLGLRVPEDVMVTGFDDIPQAGRPPYDLTTVQQPIPKMIDESLKLLGINGDTDPECAMRKSIPGKLMKRGTVRPSL